MQTLSRVNPLTRLRAHLAARRNRRVMMQRLREMAAEDEARERTHAAWRAEAVAPEAVRIAREMAVQA